MNPEIEIRPFPRDPSRSEFEALNRHTNRLRGERLPDDPPIPLEESIQNMQNLPPVVDLHMWAAWKEGQNEIAALGHVVFLRMEQNQHLAQFDISVLPEYRRQGLGRKLLSLICETAKNEMRRLLMTNTVDRIPGGEAFMLRIGAQKGLEAHTNQLRIEDLDREMLARWLEQGKENLESYEPGFWEGPYPEDELEAIARLHDLTNQQPLGSLEIEDMHMTPAQLRDVEKNLFARGSQRWTYHIQERASSQYAGYSETIWNPNRPEILVQDMTGVFPEHRGRGLGRWLKALMLDKVLKDRPKVKYVRTGNADSNAAMLKINTELGFKPYMAESLWQVELERVLDYLASRT
jgi:mycothiol synthase